MKTKEYVKKYGENFDIMEFTADLADEFSSYLKLNEGKMTVVRFHNGVKQLFEKLKNIQLKLELPEERYVALSKYFFATVIIPSYKLYWKNDYFYREANNDEYYGKRDKIRKNINDVYSNNVHDTHHRGSVVKPMHFQNYSAYDHRYFENQRRFTTIDSLRKRIINTGNPCSDHEFGSFFQWFKYVCKPVFSIDTDVVIDERPKGKYQQYTNTSNQYPKRIVDALSFLGLLNDTVTEINSQMVKHSYRMLSKIHHPDLGGDSETFIQLTEYVDTLLKYFK